MIHMALGGNPPLIFMRNILTNLLSPLTNARQIAHSNNLRLTVLYSANLTTGSTAPRFVS